MRAQRAGFMRADARKTSQFKAFQCMGGTLRRNLLLEPFGRGYMIGFFCNAAGARATSAFKASMVPVSPWMRLFRQRAGLGAGLLWSHSAYIHARCNLKGSAACAG